MDSTATEAYLKETLPFFKKLSPEQQALLARSTLSRTYVQGEMIHSGPEDCVGLVLLQSGQARAYFLSDTGREVTLFRLFERDLCLFSASCMLKNITFDVYLSAQRETSALIIPAPVYKQLSEASVLVADYSSQLMASRFSDVMWVMEQVLFMSFDKRLALFLLEQAAIEDSMEIHVTQEEIAKHLGTAREVVTRMLKYFQQEQIAESFRGGVRILDEKKLFELTKEKH